jgi:uncharacterized membrane protein
MHNLDSFLQHVEDDLAAPETVVAAPAPAAAKGKGKKAATKEVAVVSSQESEEVPAQVKKADKLHGGVNFVLGDIDTASSLVSKPCISSVSLSMCI